MRVDDADLLDEFLEEQRIYSSDFQALVYTYGVTPWG